MGRKTPFYDYHILNNAKIVDFAGFEMPLQFSSIIEEHNNVRTNVGVFDISHMGNILVVGKDAENFIQYVVTNDVSKLIPGKVQYSVMCYPDGGIVDDLLIYKISENEFFLVVNASNIEKDFDWLLSQQKGDVVVQNMSYSTAALAVQGPRSLDVMQNIVDFDLNSLSYYTFADGSIAGVKMIISRTGYTGELGFELFFDAEGLNSKKVWDAIFEAGKPYNIVPAGLGARDTLRLEMGYRLYGNDIDNTTNPIEAGLAWVAKFDKENFIGKEALLEIKKSGPKRKLVGFMMNDKFIARHGYKIFAQNEEIGFVTSGTYSPSLGKGIGMGYVECKYASQGTDIYFSFKEKTGKATIVKIPFLIKN